jgi:hypothetical protein
MSLVKDSNSEIIDKTTYKKIPLKNNKKEIIDYALVSNEDYKEVIKYKWCISINTINKYKTVVGYVNGNVINLSHFIKGKPKIGNVVDHLNNNSLDNRRENLEFATNSQNSQNRKKTLQDTSSKFIGVHYNKEKEKWTARCASKFLGNFENEEDAAKIYDKYALIKFGKNASTNNLVDYEEVKNLTLEDIKPTKIINTKYPKYICFSNNKYYVQITYNKKKYTKNFNTLEEAIKQLDIYKEEIEEIKKNQKITHITKEITRNNDGFAIINLYDKNKNIIAETIVDDDKWHHLSLFSWYLSQNNYVRGSLKNGKTDVSLHRYLMNADENIFIDHINQKSLDNRLSNLRPASSSENNHNRKKINLNASSIFKGVCKTKNYWRVNISKDKQDYKLGNYKIELQAALAYNLKAIELFGEYANINEIDLDEETEQKYKEEIYIKWEEILTY